MVVHALWCVLATIAPQRPSALLPPCAPIRYTHSPALLAPAGTAACTSCPHRKPCFACLAAQPTAPCASWTCSAAPAPSCCACTTAVAWWPCRLCGALAAPIFWSGGFPAGQAGSLPARRATAPPCSVWRWQPAPDMWATLAALLAALPPMSVPHGLLDPPLLQRRRRQLPADHRRGQQPDAGRSRGASR